MLNILQFTRSSIEVLMVGVLFLFLQSCETPLINVQVDATLDGKVCKKGGPGEDTEGVGACVPTVIRNTTQHDGLTCKHGGGSHICSSENSRCIHPSLPWVCDTIQVMGDKCACTCTTNPT